MMQRTGIFLLAFLYLFSTAGTVVNIHYCMGQVASVSVGSFGGGSSACMAHSDCCRTEGKVVKLSDVHQPGGCPLTIIGITPIAGHPFSLLQTSLYQRPDIHRWIARPPPSKASPSLFLQYCTFRI